MDYIFQCIANEDVDALCKEITRRCFYLNPNEHLTVFEFGENGDLRLDIYKDEDYDKKTNDYNLAVIHTSQKINNTMVDVDDTEDTYVGLLDEYSDFERELHRIYQYKNFSTL